MTPSAPLIAALVFAGAALLVPTSRGREWLFWVLVSIATLFWLYAVWLLLPDLSSAPGAQKG